MTMSDGDKACYAPGWDKGPETQGGEPDIFLCELDGGHEGPHAWDLDGNLATVTWPVAEVGNEQDG